jgi:hypothetical protein
MQQPAGSCMCKFNPYCFRLYPNGTCVYDLGQSAATAAALAIDQKTDVHSLEYNALKERLLKTIRSFSSSLMKILFNSNYN